MMGLAAELEYWKQKPDTHVMMYVCMRQPPTYLVQEGAEPQRRLVALVVRLARVPPHADLRDLPRLRVM